MERDYNAEMKDNTERKYKYQFDYDIMHPYMLKAFSPYFRGADALELGCFRGNFTKRLLDYFQNITCVEASSEAVMAAESYVDSNKVQFVNELFEKAVLPQKYNNIFLTHVLEHIDDRVGLLQKIKEEWLDDNGVLFVACPNANAPSRQIAVHMDLISHNCAVTEGERLHGHRVTYSLDTLGRDLRQAGLQTIHYSGIFFKALANFQWDRLMGTDIISKEYLDGCYELGKKYPDLCSSIFFVCTK